MQAEILSIISNNYSNIVHMDGEFKKCYRTYMHVNHKTYILSLKVTTPCMHHCFLGIKTNYMTGRPYNLRSTTLCTSTICWVCLYLLLTRYYSVITITLNMYLPYCIRTPALYIWLIYSLFEI